MSLLTNIVAYWKLDESSGDASDSVGSNTAVNSGVTYSAAKINNGAVFDANSDALVISPTNFDFARTQAFSVSFWINKNSSSASQCFAICHQLESGDTGQGWRINHQGSGDPRIYFILANNAGGTNLISVKTPNASAGDDTWLHVVMTYDGSSTAAGVHIYINNSDQTLTVNSDNLSASTSSAANLKFNNRNVTDSVPATMDEIGIWTRVLTSGEVTSLYNGGTGVQYPFGASGNSNFLIFM